MDVDEMRWCLLTTMAPGLLALRWSRRGAAPWQQARWFEHLAALGIRERSGFSFTRGTLEGFPGGPAALFDALVRGADDPALESWLDELEAKAIR